MQSLETPDNLDEDVPDLLLLDVGLSFLVTANLLEHIAVVSVLHDEAKAGAALVDEGLFVGDHVLVDDAGQYAHLVQGVLLLFL